MASFPDYLVVGCPHCKSDPGLPCKTATGFYGSAGGPHAARRNLAAQMSDADIWAAHAALQADQAARRAAADQVFAARRAGAHTAPLRTEIHMPGSEIEIAVLTGEVVETLPADWAEIGLGMSNFDHKIDDGLDQALRAGGVWGRHAAWEFNGRVWFANGRFHEQVWRHRSPVATVTADTLPELMTEVNARWGND